MDYILGLLYATKRFERRERRRHLSPTPSSPLSLPSREVHYMTSSTRNANENKNVNIDATHANTELLSELSPECGTNSTITIPPLQIHTSPLHSEKQKSEEDNSPNDNTPRANVAPQLRIGESSKRDNEQCLCTDKSAATLKSTPLFPSTPLQVPLCTSAPTDTHLERASKQEETIIPIQVIGVKQSVVGNNTSPNSSLSGRGEMEKKMWHINEMERRNVKSVITANRSENMNSVTSNNLNSSNNNYCKLTNEDLTGACTSVPIAELANKFILVYLPSPYAVFNDNDDDDDDDNDVKCRNEFNKSNKLCYCTQQKEEISEEEEEKEELEWYDDDDGDNGNGNDKEDREEGNVQEQQNKNSNKIRQTSLHVENENHGFVNENNIESVKESKNNDDEIASNLQTRCNVVNTGSDNSNEMKEQLQKVNHTSKHEEVAKLSCPKSSCILKTQSLLSTTAASPPLLTEENIDSAAPISSTPHNPISHSPQPPPPLLSSDSAAGATRLLEHESSYQLKEPHMSIIQPVLSSPEMLSSAATTAAAAAAAAAAEAANVKEAKTTTKESLEPLLLPPLALSSAFTSLHDMLEQHASRSPLHSHRISGGASSFTNLANVNANSSSLSAPASANTTQETASGSGAVVVTTTTTTAKASTATRGTSKPIHSDQHCNSTHQKNTINNNINNTNNINNINYNPSTYSGWRVECAKCTREANESELVEQHLLAFYCSLLNSLQFCNRNNILNNTHDNVQHTEKDNKLLSSSLESSRPAEKLLHTLQLLTNKRMSSVAVLEVRHTNVNRECAVLPSLPNSSHMTSSTPRRPNRSYHSPIRQSSSMHNSQEKNSPLRAVNSSLKLEKDKSVNATEWQDSKKNKGNRNDSYNNKEEVKKVKTEKTVSAETSMQEQSDLAANATKLIPVLHIPVKELVSSNILQLASMTSEEENKKDMTKSPTIHLSTNFASNMEKTPQSDSHNMKAFCSTSQVSSSSLLLSPHSNAIMKRGNTNRKLHSSRHTIQRVIYNLLFHSRYRHEFNGHNKELPKRFYFDNHEELFSNPLYGG